MNFDKLKSKLDESYKFKSRAHIWHAALELVTDMHICLEFGVYNGKSINYMSDVRPDNMFYGFDSFEGLPDPYLYCPVGHFKTNFSKLKFNRNVKIFKGWFEETIPMFLGEQTEKERKNIRLLHIDCDVYSSTKTILRYFQNIIQNNKCVLLFDEFHNFEGFEKHEFLAFLEFIDETRNEYDIIGRNVRHQQSLIKII